MLQRRSDGAKLRVMAKATISADEKALRDHGLSYPDAAEDFPWGERALKVRGKVFAFLHRVEDGGLSVTVKLPQSGHAVTMLPYVQPSGYGLGKAGWVTARFAAKERLPLPVLKAWVDESYRAVAPKTLVKQLAAPMDPPAATRKTARARRSPR